MIKIFHLSVELDYKEKFSRKGNNNKKMMLLIFSVSRGSYLTSLKLKRKQR